MDELRILNTNFELEAIIDDYISLVWTDRYSTAGEFVLTLANTSENVKFLKTDYYVRTAKSKSLMIIETLDNDDDTDILKCTGYSLEATFDRRINTQALTAATGAIFSGSAYTYMKNLVSDAIVIPDPPGAWKNYYDYFDFFAHGPELFGSPALVRSYASGSLYDELIAVAQLTGVGFKFQLYDIETFGTSQVPILRLDFYMGQDRSRDQTMNEWVVFAPELDNLVKVHNLDSVAGYKNVAYVLARQPGTVTTPVLKRYNAPTVTPQVASFNRRDILVDGTSINFDSYSPTNYQSKLLELAYKTLQEHKRVQIIDGTIVEGEFVYGRDYFLGDIVNLGIDEDTQQKVRITEHILSVDANGSKSYPTLTVYEEAWSGVWTGTPNPGV